MFPMLRLAYDPDLAGRQEGNEVYLKLLLVQRLYV